MTEQHPNIRRVAVALAAAGITAEVRELDESTRTAAEAAAALGVDVAQIAKTLVFRAGDDTDGVVVVVAAGDKQVDTDRLSAALDGAKIGRADADAVRAATGYAIGGVSPAGLPAGLTVLVDTALERHPVIWAAAGHPRAVYQTDFAGLLTVTGGRLVAISVDAQAP